MINVLSTKKLSATAWQLVDTKKVNLVEKDFITITPFNLIEISQQLVEMQNNGVRDLIFTSSNAVRIASDALTTSEPLKRFDDWQICCLSGKTRDEISNSAFKKFEIIAEGKDADELSQAIVRQGIKKVIFLCGKQRLNELPQQLEQAGIDLNEIITYDTQANHQLIKENFDGILFYSPSGAESYFANNTTPDNTVCFAIGKTTAEKLEGFFNGKICISPSTDQESLVSTAIEFFEKSYAEDEIKSK